MASQPIDQGAILRSGAALVPNLAEEAVRRQLAAAQVQSAQADQLRAATASSHEQREAGQQAAFQAAVQSLPAQPSVRDFAGLMFRYPQFSEAIQRGHQALDGDQQRNDFQSLAEITAAARGGHFDTAAQRMEERDTADTAAGHPPDPMHQAILQGLRSQDPQERQFAVDLLERSTAAISGPEHYASTYGTFQRRTHEVDGIVYDEDTGQALFQSPYPRIIAGPNGSFNEQPRVPTIPLLGGTPGITDAEGPSVGPVDPLAGRGGGASSSGSLPPNGRPMPAGMFGGWTVIGVPGDPRNRPGGRVVSHNGVDFRPPANNPHLTADRPLEIVAVRPDHGISGITAIARFPDGAEFNLMHLAAVPRPGHYDAGQVIATAGNTGNARSGSTQIHVQPWGATRHDPRAYFGRGTGTSSSPVRVRSIQEANRLPPGTEYITPDNRHFVIPAAGGGR